MKVIVPHVEFQPALARLLEDEGVNARFVSTHEPDGYFNCLADAWEEGESFIVLEGDKYPAPGVLHRLWECPSQWCYANAPMRYLEERAPYPSLSCAKFGEGVLQLVPDLMQHVGELDLGLGAREWSRLDLAVHGLLEPYYPAHEHLELLEHRHR